MIATNIEQSKKLVKLGIDPNTADMFYGYIAPYEYSDRKFDGGYGSYPLPKEYLYFDDEYIKNAELPAWSTEALMKLLPAEFTSIGEYSTTTYEIDIRKYKLTEDVDLYQIAYVNRSFVDSIEHWKDMINTGEKESLLDAAFQMLVELKKFKFI